MGATDETSVVLRAQAGDAQAFDELVRLYGPVIYNLALRMTGNCEDARDVTQNTFLKAWRGRDGFDPGRRFFSWLYRIAMNESLNLLRSCRPAEPLRSDCSDPLPSPEDRLEAAELGAAVARALMDIAPEQRQLLVLRYTAQLSYREIGALLTLTEQTVRSRLFSARQALGRVLERQGWSKP